MLTKSHMIGSNVRVFETKQSEHELSVIEYVSKSSQVSPCFMPYIMNYAFVAVP